MILIAVSLKIRRYQAPFYVAEMVLERNFVFCIIISGELESLKVYEDRNVYAFLDIRPLNSGHTLIVNKKHVSHFSDLTEEEAGKLFILGHKVLNSLSDKKLCTVTCILYLGLKVMDIKCDLVTLTL